MTTTTKATTDNGAAAYRAFGYLLLLVLMFGACLVGLLVGLTAGVGVGR